MIPYLQLRHMKLLRLGQINARTIGSLAANTQQSNIFGEKHLEIFREVQKQVDICARNAFFARFPFGFRLNALLTEGRRLAFGSKSQHDDSDNHANNRKSINYMTESAVLPLLEYAFHDPWEETRHAKNPTCPNSIENLHSKSTLSSELSSGSSSVNSYQSSELKSHLYQYTPDDMLLSHIPLGPDGASRHCVPSTRLLSAATEQPMYSKLCQLDGSLLDRIFDIETKPEHSTRECTKSTTASNLKCVKYEDVVHMTESYSELMNVSTVLDSDTDYRGIVHTSGGGHEAHSLVCDSSTHGDVDPDKKRPGNRPTMDQLRFMQDYMAEHLPKIFSKRHDYRIYTADVVFENNYFEKSYKTTGISKYVMEIAKIRMYAHFKYANVRMRLISSACEEDEGAVIVRWRIGGLPQSQAFMFWKFMPWNYKKQLDAEAKWHDGISTFYIDGMGMIYHHTIDKVEIDKDRTVDERKQTIVDKLIRSAAPVGSVS